MLRHNKVNFGTLVSSNVISYNHAVYIMAHPLYCEFTRPSLVVATFIVSPIRRWYVDLIFYISI